MKNFRPNVAKLIWNLHKILSLNFRDHSNYYIELLLLFASSDRQLMATITNDLTRENFWQANTESQSDNVDDPIHNQLE